MDGKCRKSVGERRKEWKHTEEKKGMGKEVIVKFALISVVLPAHHPPTVGGTAFLLILSISVHVV